MAHENRSVQKAWICGKGYIESQGKMSAIKSQPPLPAVQAINTKNKQELLTLNQKASV